MREKHVQWAVPEDKVTYNKHGRAIITPPTFLPFLWEKCEFSREPTV
jgi:hypothetical protein